MSQIKKFREDAEFKAESTDVESAIGEFDFKTAEKKILRQFNEWKKKEKPVILSTNFGRRHGVFIEEDPHYWYIEVLYE